MPQGLIEGYASVFGGIDRHGDTIRPGAYAASLTRHKSAGSLPLMLWSHRQDSPIGRWLDVREDARGLLVEGRLNLKTQAGSDAFEHLSAGDLNGLSIGYRIAPNGAKQVGGVNELSRVELEEVSLVALPADADARVLSVKSQAIKPMTLRGLEEALQDLGYSRREARNISAKGYIGLVADEPDETNELTLALKAATTLLQKAPPGVGWRARRPRSQCFSSASGY